MDRSTDGAGGRRTDWFARLMSGRHLLAAALILFGVLWASGRIDAWVFLALSSTMLVAGLVAPVRTKAGRRGGQGRADGSSGDLAVFGSALDGVPDPALLIDNRGVVRYANRAYRRILGAIQPGGSVLVRFRSPEVVEMIQLALAGQRPDPVELVERSPREHWFLVSIAPLTTASRPVGGHIVHFRDLSELRRAERMRTDFIANASHELRTPLASLAGFIETLQGPARADEAARERFLQIMREQAERMSRLIDDLLSLSRFETALGRSDFTRVDLIDVLVHVVGAFQPVAARDDITVKLDHDMVPADHVDVYGSRDELIQLFDNLAENAIKYGRDGKRLDFLVEPGRLGGLPALTVEVRDFGAGISEDHLPRLTERFYRVDVETSRGKQGTGLGLAIVKHIVTRHEGRLVIRSRPGEGTRVIVTLPLMVRDSSPKTEETSAISDA